MHDHCRAWDEGDMTDKGPNTATIHEANMPPIQEIRPHCSHQQARYYTTSLLLLLLDALVTTRGLQAKHQHETAHTYLYKAPPGGRTDSVYRKGQKGEHRVDITLGEHS